MDAPISIKPNYSSLNGHSSINGTGHFQDALHANGIVALQSQGGQIDPNGVHLNANGEMVDRNGLVIDSNGVKEELEDVPFPSMEELERELPFVVEGQVHLGLVMHQMVQDLYSQLLNIAETLGRAPDTVKKAKLQNWLTQAYKQSSKLYVLSKWSRSASDIQLALNIAAFLRTQGEQIIWATKALHSVQDESHRLRVRNPDLLTSLDVLTRGEYTRLGGVWKETFVKQPKLGRRAVWEVFKQTEDVMRMRLLCRDVVPVEMSDWRIQGGRVWFRVEKRFETSLIMTGARADDYWAFVSVEFLFGVPEGERKGSREFPHRPPKAVSDDVAFQIRDVIMTPGITPSLNPSSAPMTSTVEPLATSAVVDVPLVRVYNFLQLLSLTYQLEILIFQAVQLREFGWKDSLRIKIAPDRKSVGVQYWVRQPPPTFPPGIQLNLPVFASSLAAAVASSRTPATALVGGEITISIVPDTTPSSSSSSTTSPQVQRSGLPLSTSGLPLSASGLPTPSNSAQPLFSSVQSGTNPGRSPTDKIKAMMQDRLKLKGARPSDEVERWKFEVVWKPQQGALGVMVPPGVGGGLEVDSDCLDFEGLLKKVLRRHADAIMAHHLEQARNSTIMHMFPHAEDVRYVEHDGGTAMRIQLAGSQYIIINIELQTGKFIIHESGDLGAAQRGVRWNYSQLRINREPGVMLELCARLRHTAILELVTTRANLLGISTYNHRNLAPTSLARFKSNYGLLYLQLGGFRNHFVVLVIREGGFGVALIQVQEKMDDYGMGEGEFFITDFAWVQAERILPIGRRDDELDESDDEHDLDHSQEQDSDMLGVEGPASRKRKRSIHDVGIKAPLDPAVIKDPFDISIRELRDLHAYCRARVAHYIIESQLKARNIPYVETSSGRVIPPNDVGSINGVGARGGKGSMAVMTSKSPLEEYLPVLCVQTSDLLAGAAAAEAAMPNIRIEPTEWWSLDKECKVHTSVRLKYVQPLDGTTESTGAAKSKEDKELIRVSENISYDVRSSVVTFLSHRVVDCVDEFLKEWARVSKVVVIARQVSLMPSAKGWKDVRILSFDLQTVEFAYYQDYAMSITSVEGNYRLSFSRCAKPRSSSEDKSSETAATPRTKSLAGSPMKVDTPSAKTPRSLTLSQSQALPPPESQSVPSTQSQSRKPTLPRRNAHRDSVRFAQELLKDDRLGASVFELVAFLRNTVGIVEALDGIEDAEEANVANSQAMDHDKKSVGERFNVLVKAAGWWRVRYGSAVLFGKDARGYAMDVRMLGGRFIIVDSSVELGKTASSSSAAPTGLLGAVPKMAEHVKTVLEEIKKERMGDAEVVPVNYGSAVICGAKDAPMIMRKLHERILEGLFVPALLLTMKKLQRIKTYLNKKPQHQDDKIPQNLTDVRQPPIAPFRNIPVPTTPVRPKPKPIPIPICNQVPVEIWREIFSHLTTIPGKSEFSLEAAAYWPLDCDDPPIETDKFSKQDRLLIRRERLKVIRVCRYWYSIGIQFLWSHLSLHYGFRFEELPRILNHNPTLASFVMRFTIQILPQDFEVEAAAAVVNLLPNLKIIDCPRSLGTAAYFLRPEVVVLNAHNDRTHVLQYLRRDEWANIRLLIVQRHYDEITANCPNVLEIPRLETLYVEDHSGSLLQFMADWWSMPSIRTLSLRTYNSNDGFIPAFQMISTYAGQLEKIEIFVQTPENLSDFDAIQMDELKILYITYDFKAWVAIIRAPSLFRLGISDWPYGSRHKATKDTIDPIISGFPMVAELCLKGLSVSRYITEKGIQDWERKGLRVTKILIGKIS